MGMYIAMLVAYRVQWATLSIQYTALGPFCSCLVWVWHTFSPLQILLAVNACRHVLKVYLQSKELP